LIPAKHLEKFDPMKLQEETFDEADLQPGGVAYGMVWGRDTSPENVHAFLDRVEANLIVTGHIPADHGFTIPNPYQLTLDCSASPGGYVLFRTDEPITHDDLVIGVGTV
jgi:hypothetical protein